jgi:hypothetical protein
MRQYWKMQLSSIVLGRRYLSVLQGLILLFTVGLVALFAFAHLFTTFVWWDDEGYFLQAYHEVLSGRIPYDQVFAYYGPVTFLGAALVTGFHAANVTHDYFRWALLPAWLLIASILAGVVWRWTGRFGVAVVVLLLVGFRLGNLSRSVGHPQVWIILAVASLLWFGLDWIYRSERFWHPLWSGFITGVILLCKINIGVYVLIALGLAVSSQLRGRTRALARGMLMIAAAGVGLLLFFTSSTGADKYFALAYLVSLMAIGAIAFVQPLEQPPPTSLKWILIGFGICLFVGIGATLGYGTTAEALFRSLITEPVRLVKSYHSPFQDATHKASILLSVVAFCSAAGIPYWRRIAGVRPALFGLLKVAIAAGLLFAFSYNHRLTLTGSLLFSWLLLVDAPPLSGPRYCNRLLLALLCLLFSLQVFPVAGDQVDWASLLPITAAAVLLADGINCIDHESLADGSPSLPRIIAGGVAPLLVILLILFGGVNAKIRFSRWCNAQPVNLSGTHWLRLPPVERSRLTTTVSEVSQNCRAILIVPGLYSFSLWSGVPSSEDKRVNTWPFFWSKEIQRNELLKLQRQDQGCVLVSWTEYQFLKEMAVSPGHDELLSEIQRTMTPIFAIEDLTLFKSNQRPSALQHPEIPVHNKPETASQ